MSSTPHFAPVGEKRFQFEQRLTTAGLVDRVGSTSYIANLPEPAHSQVLEKVRALGSDSGGEVTLRYETEAYLYGRRS
jgi:hypothetical protein